MVFNTQEYDLPSPTYTVYKYTVEPSTGRVFCFGVDQPTKLWETTKRITYDDPQELFHPYRILRFFQYLFILTILVSFFAYVFTRLMIIIQCGTTREGCLYTANTAAATTSSKEYVI